MKMLLLIVSALILVGCETKRKLTRYDVAFNMLIGNEGGYVNDPRDPGGETKYGICKKYEPDIDIKNITLSFAKKYYRKKYWKTFYERIHNSKIALKLFDTFVNIGEGGLKKVINETLMDGYCCTDEMLVAQLNAVIAVDELLKKPRDWEDFTVRAINRMSSNLFLNIFRAKLVNYYCSIIQRKNNLVVFREGLVNRAVK